MTAFFWIVFLVLAGLVGLSFVPAFGPVRRFTGWTMLIVGYCLAAYVATYVMFIGGVINVVDGAKDNPTNAGLIAWGLIRALILSGIFGRLIIMGTVRALKWFTNTVPND